LNNHPTMRVAAKTTRTQLPPVQLARSPVHVRKRFSVPAQKRRRKVLQWFYGRVVETWTCTGAKKMHRVVYEDSDSEDMSSDELEKHVITKAPPAAVCKVLDTKEQTRKPDTKRPLSDRDQWVPTYKFGCWSL